MKTLLYTHINLSLALLLGLVVFIAGLEPARSIGVSELDYKVYAFVLIVAHRWHPYSVTLCLFILYLSVSIHPFPKNYSKEINAILEQNH